MATVAIIATVMLMLSAALAQGLFGHQQSSVSIEQGLDAESAAEACADRALLALALDAAYAGSETIAVGSASCTIRPIVVIGVTTVIETEATVDGQTYRLQVDLSAIGPPPVISGWERVGSF